MMGLPIIVADIVWFLEKQIQYPLETLSDMMTYVPYAFFLLFIGFVVMVFLNERNLRIRSILQSSSFRN